MKNLALIVLGMGMLAACADISKYTTVDSNASAKTKMKACLVSEANTKFQAGTLFVSGISATASELVSTCTQKLTLQSAGISSESQSTAETIIKNLQGLSSATSAN